MNKHRIISRIKTLTWSSSSNKRNTNTKRPNIKAARNFHLSHSISKATETVYFLPGSCTLSRYNQFSSLVRRLSLHECMQKYAELVDSGGMETECRPAQGTRTNVAPRKRKRRRAIFIPVWKHACWKLTTPKDGLGVAEAIF